MDYIVSCDETWSVSQNTRHKVSINGIAPFQMNNKTKDTRDAMARAMRQGVLLIFSRGVGERITHRQELVRDSRCMGLSGSSGLPTKLPPPFSGALIVPSEPVGFNPHGN